VFTAAKRYGVDVETLLGQAEGSFALVSKLLDEGIINEKGEVVVKNTGSGSGSGAGTGAGGPPAAPPAWAKPGANDPTNEDRIAAIVHKALGDSFGKLEQRLKSLEGDITSMTEQQLRAQIKGQHPDLNDREITQLFQQAMGDRSKSLWDHAKDLDEAKKNELHELRKKHAAEFGVNVEEFDQNKLRQQDGVKGAAAVVQGKKISFRRSGEGEAVTPLQATKEFFASREAEGS
jgi:TolA-binding protein